MPESHFDAFVRALAGGPITRRAVSGGLLGVTLTTTLTVFDRQEGEARKRRKRKKRVRRKQGTAPSAAPCVPESAAVTCAGVCGTQTNNCGQSVSCSCRDGFSCLSNGTCAQACADDDECGAGRICSTPTTEGARHCHDERIGCFDVSQICASTAQCPTGQHCQVTRCAEVGRPPVVCVPVITG